MINLLFLISGLGITALMFFAPIFDVGIDLGLLLSAIAITYAIIAGFWINRLQDKHNRILGLASQEDAYYKSLFRYVRLLGAPELTQKLAHRLKNHYDFVELYFENPNDRKLDFIDNSRETFVFLNTFLAEVYTKLADPQKHQIRIERISIIMEQLDINRMEWINRLQVRVPLRDWTLLLVLSLLLITILFFFRNGDIFIHGILACASISIILILYIITELQKLRLGKYAIGHDSAREVMRVVDRTLKDSE